VVGASYGTINVIIPLAVPLLVIPLLYTLPELYAPEVVCIQKGCPTADILNV
jgi:hypothetical protein